MTYTDFTERQKSAYWDTYHTDEQVTDYREHRRWLIEYRKYSRPNGETMQDFVLFLVGDYIGRFDHKDINALYEVLQNFR